MLQHIIKEDWSFPAMIGHEQPLLNQHATGPVKCSQRHFSIRAPVDENMGIGHPQIPQPVIETSSWLVGLYQNVEFATG